jgi:hypothetical protein
MSKKLIAAILGALLFTSGGLALAGDDRGRYRYDDDHGKHGRDYDDDGPGHHGNHGHGNHGHGNHGHGKHHGHAKHYHARPYWYPYAYRPAPHHGHWGPRYHFDDGLTIIFKGRIH